MSLPPSALETSVHRAEQAWNQQQLATAVTQPDFRLWTYSAPAVVLGCSQRGLVSEEQSVQRAGLDLVQRHAGGGAVLVGPWMLSASIALPSSHPLVTASAVQSYRWLGELFVSVLSEAGIATEALTPEAAKASQQRNANSELGWACFAGLSPWEVVVGRRKIVGLAQVRRRTGNLLVAGLLLDRPEWPLLCRAMGKPVEQAMALESCTTSCAEQAGRIIAVTDMAAALDRALRDVLALAVAER